MHAHSPPQPLQWLPSVLLVLFALAGPGCSHLRTASAPGPDTVVSYFLPEPWIQVDIYEESLGPGRSKYHTRVQSLPVPDEELPLYLNLHHSASTRDQVNVSVAPSGLLQRITYDRFPRGADAVVALGKAALKAASMVAGVPLKGDGAAPEFSRLVAREVYPITIDGQIDVARLQRRAVPVTITYNGVVFSIAVQPSKQGQVAAGLYPTVSEFPKAGDAAFHYRPLRPIQVTVTWPSSAGAAGDSQLSGILYVPDLRRVEQFVIPTSTSAKQSYDFVFTDGTLSDVAVRKESGLLTIAEVPGQILGTVTGLPAQLISVEVNHNPPASDPRLSTGDDKGSGNTRPRSIKE